MEKNTFITSLLFIYHFCFSVEQNAQSMIVINSIELDPHALQKQESVFQDSSTG